MQMDEDDITTRLRNGDITALELVYKEYADKLYSFVLSISKRKETAEDVVADVFVMLYSYLSDGKHVNNLKSFLYTSVRNAAYDKLKFASRNVSLPEDDIYIDNSIDMSVKLSITDALDRLPSDEREIVLLYCYENFLHKEIAQILDMPEGTVRWKYRKAISSLKTIFGGDFDDR
jgi:RNA polymerase sigma-70 factor (ECF subfamily)